MKGLKGMGLGIRAAAAVVLALGAGLLASAQVSAQDETISIGRVTVVPGAQGTVDLEALNIDPPGLGAWEIGIFYDPEVITAVACSPQAGSVCNVDFAPNRVVVTGATGFGHVGDTTLASITFACGASEGASALTVALPVLADATPGNPQKIDATVENGSVTCTPAGGVTPRPTSTPRAGQPTAAPTEKKEGPAPTATAKPSVNGLPASGAGNGAGGGNALGWLVAALAGAGLAGMAGFGAMRLRFRRASEERGRHT